MYDGEIRIDSRIDTKGIDEGIREINSKLTASIKGLSSLMKGAGLAAGALSLSKAIDSIAASTAALENSLRAASTLFGDVSVDMDGLRDKIMRLSSETGIAAEQIGGALYEALSSGVPVTEDMGEAMEFLRQSAQAAKGGFADLEGTVTSTAAVINAYGMSVEDAGRVQGILMQTQNKGMTTIGQLSTSLARVIPTASAFGVSFEQIGAALATTTAGGTQTAEAVTGLNALLSELGKQGMKGADALLEASKAAGLGEKSFQELVSEGYTIGDILSMMETYAKRTDRTLVDLFGSIEAGRTALQLAGENAGKFSENLESMYDTEGLVASAADLVTTGTERLGAALRNAGSDIGQRFEPAVQDAASRLADMVNAMFDNTDEAGNLETAIGNVNTALESYRTAQENAKAATDDTTLSMELQSQAAYMKALSEMAVAFDDMRISIEEKDAALADSTERQEEAREALQRYAEEAGVTIQDLQRLTQAYVNAGNGYADVRRAQQALSDIGISGSKREEIIALVEQYSSATTEISTLNADISRSADEMARSVYQAYLMIKEDSSMLEDVQAVSIDFADSIMTLGAAYEAGMEDVSGSIGGTEAELESLLSQLKDAQSGLDEGSEEFIRLAGSIDSVTAALGRMQKAGSSGKPSSGSSGSGSASGSQPSGDRSIADVWADLAKGFDDNSKKAEVFGESFDEIGGNISLVEGAINELIEDFNLDPASQDVQYLKDALAGLQEQADSSQEALKRMGEALLAWSESAATSFAQSIGSGISQLVTDFMTIDEQVKALNEELGDAQAEQIERNEALAEAEEEYRLALLEGNQSEIDAALESLQAAEDSKEAQDEKVASLKDEIKATEDGTKAWESFGKSALSALADVLEGLGAQLAAQAVAQAIAFNWVNAAIAAAGSIAAYAAAGAIRGLAGSYAEGGIVPQVAGVPSTGDQHIARVNPGELILNEAQQGNIASLLTAQQAIIDSRKADTAGDARSIVIEIDGDIYGLDSEEVGRAIYRNIRSLQEEGRIGRWR